MFASIFELGVTTCAFFWADLELGGFRHVGQTEWDQALKKRKGHCFQVLKRAGCWNEDPYFCVQSPYFDTFPGTEPLYRWCKLYVSPSLFKLCMVFLRFESKIKQPCY